MLQALPAYVPIGHLLGSHKPTSQQSFVERYETNQNWLVVSFSLVLQLYNYFCQNSLDAVSLYLVKLFFFLSMHHSFNIIHFPFSLNLKCVTGRCLTANNDGHVEGFCMGFSFMSARLCLRQCIYFHKSDMSGKDLSRNNCIRI